MQAWSQLYTAVAAVAATLLGLLFVAVSINAGKLISRGREGSRRLAEQAFRSYITLIFLSLVALFPGMPLTDFGRAALAVTTSSALLSVFHLHVIFTARDERQRVLPSMSSRLVSAVIGYGLLMVAEVGIGFFRQDLTGTLASGALVLLSSAALTSWDLLLSLANASATDTPPRD